MDAQPPVIGLLISRPAERARLLSLIDPTGRVLRAPDPACWSEADWSGLSLLIVDEAAARLRRADLLALKQNAPAYLPILVLCAARADAGPWLALGFDDVLRRPLRAAELRARLALLLRLQQAAGAQPAAPGLQRAAAFDETSFGLTYLDAEGRIIFRSPAVARMSGYTDAERIGHSVLELAHPDDLDLVRARLAAVFAQPGHTATLVYRNRRSDGQWRWLEASFTNLLREPAVAAVAAHFHDVTDRLRDEAGLRSNRQLLQTIIDSVPALVAYLAADGRIRFANRMYAGRFGLTPEQVVGRALPDVLGGEIYEAVRERLAIALRGRPVQFEQILRYPDLGERHMLLSYVPHRDETGAVPGLVIVAYDITERKQAEERLRRSEANLAAAQRIARLGSWELDLADLDDLNANRLRLSAEVSRIFGLAPEAVEVANETFFTVVHPDDRELIRRTVTAALRDRAPYLVDHRILLPDGSERIVREASDIVYDPQTGRPLKMVGTVQDITDLKRAEQALQAKNEEISAMSQQLWQAAKLATVGELAASVAHELNNPLAIISLRIESLLRRLPAEAAERAALDTVAGEIERMSRLIADLLQFSRRGARQTATVDVRAELDSTLEFVHHFLEQRRVSVVRAFAPDTPLIQADRQQLRQLFLNLLTNASDAMPDGGTLTVRAAPGVLREAPAALIEFQDTGVGIAPPDLAAIWEPFFTTKPHGRGTGLGLAICRRVVEEHGGTIEIESVEGRGTTVRCALPAQPQPGPD